MKKWGERVERAGEGRLLAAILCLVLALSLFVYLGQRPRVQTIAPLHDADYELLRRIEMVDVNSAGVQELNRLPGIGEGLAQRIIAYRDENGPFSCIEDLMDVPGIGEGKFDAIREKIFAG